VGELGLEEVELRARGVEQHGEPARRAGASAASHQREQRVAIAFTPIFARLARGQTLAVMANDYVVAARSVGVPGIRLLYIYILPNIRDVLIVQALLLFSGAIVGEAGLSFVGAGISRPAVTWGLMLHDAYDHILSNPGTAVAPSVAIMLVVLSANLLGDFIRDRLDVSVRL
jgi:peptide/nickel transport system permease protein